MRGRFFFGGFSLVVKRSKILRGAVHRFGVREGGGGGVLVYLSFLPIPSSKCYVDTLTWKICVRVARDE